MAQATPVSQVEPLYRLADLIDNVVSGLKRNSSGSQPAIANDRLMKTAAKMVEEMSSNRPVASGPTSRALEAYKTGSGQQALALRLRTSGLAIEVVEAFQSTPVATEEQVSRAVEVLDALRLRAMADHTPIVGSSLDSQA